MNQAMGEIVTIEVTRAVRDSTVGGVEVSEGQMIGLVDGELAVASDSPEEALRRCLEAAGISSDMVVTLYLGEDGSNDDAEALVREMESRLPGIHVDLVYGGQPHYHYLASIE